MYDTILLPTDGSDQAVRAAEHGQYLAQLFDATAHVIAVVDIDSAAGPFNAGGVGDDDFVAQLELEHQAMIETVADVVSETTSVETAVCHGEPAATILEYAADHDVDVIAMGTHGRTGLRRFLVGSVTERVVRQAHCPVLTVREAEQQGIHIGYETMLLPTDGSDDAEAAVDHALDVAEQAGATVHVVTVVDDNAFTLRKGEAPPSEIAADLESTGESFTESVAELARDRNIEAVTAVRTGSPAGELLDHVDENDVDLIAMGTAGRTGLDRVLLGSTTERVIRHADVPVLTVNASDQ